jgi:hypothetical protein
MTFRSLSHLRRCTGIAAIVVAVTTTSCTTSTNSNSDEDPMLVGTWKYNSQLYRASDGDQWVDTIYLTFQYGGSYREIWHSLDWTLSEVSSDTLYGTWKTDAFDRLTTTIDAQPVVESYTVDSRTLALTGSDNSTRLFAKK